MNNILITAIGSMSTPTVLECLSLDKDNLLFGTDIYPKEWQANLDWLSAFDQVPKATNPAFISEIIEICLANAIKYIIPLTDPEVDILNENRNLFEEKGIKLCISGEETIIKCRNKESIGHIFENSTDIRVISQLSQDLLNDDSVYPCVAKPKTGRSSEGLFVLKNKKWADIIDCKADYIFQPYIQGTVITVDIVRDKNGNTVSLARKELLRTSNGAGLTVEIIQDPNLDVIVNRIVKKLDILGCINIEFLFDNRNYFLMDINPRFSAGVGFSLLAGYDFVSNHLNCFQNKNISGLGTVTKGILSRESSVKRLSKDT